MTPRMVLEGIYTPVITPFHADGAIDHDALADLVERLVAAGVHGLISGGSTGENYAETVEERLELARFITERADGRLPVIVGTGAMRTPDSIALAAGAREMGADAILLGTPPYSVPTEAENAANALEIDRAADLPVILYNYPGRMGVSMGRAFLDIVSQSKNVIGIKESSGDVNRIHLLACDYPNIQLSCGMDDQALEFFAWGARSWICAGSNFLPEEHVALYEACAVRGDFAKGRKIMAAMMPLMAVLEQGGKFIQCVKHGVEVSGLRAGPMRPPLQGLNAEEKAELEAVIATLKTTVAAIVEGK
ncbi:dihydrodipicolinate synthase family protein [Paracoccus binzhouensis]|uniref:dihydrodipicolinate synthase family protein n=1 Tax=Paracoccus binzhouensis TaxID=2796149 RepID=UPI0038CD6532